MARPWPDLKTKDAVIKYLQGNMFKIYDAKLNLSAVWLLESRVEAN